jgi:hypothetical protein
MNLIKGINKMFLTPAAAIAIIIITHFTSSLAFCHINEASNIEKYMMLHSKPASAILVNHMISKYAKTRGIPEYQIKNCVEVKKKAINSKNNVKKPNLRKVKKG